MLLTHKLATTASVPIHTTLFMLSMLLARLTLTIDTRPREAFSVTIAGCGPPLPPFSSEEEKRLAIGRRRRGGGV